MVSSNTETGITVTYDDTNAKIDFAVTSQTDENFTSALKTKLEGISSGAEVNQNAFSTIAVSGQTSVNADSNTDTLTLAEGNGITLTTDAGSDTVTITSTATGSVSEAFKTISISGQSDIVADSATDTLTLAAGSNITLTTDAATDTITIASTASGGGGSVDVVTTQHSGDGSTQGFALDSTPGDNDAVQVYLNGVYQVKDAANYSISGSTLTFVTPPTNSTAIEFVHFKLTSGGGGGISWVTDDKTANFTATAGSGYLVDTSSSAITVTLPSSPSFGDEIIVIDYKGNAATNNITLGRNSLNIQGAASDYTVDTNNESVRLLYSGATQGWVITSDAGAGAGAAAAPAITVDYLIVAGGGSGGATPASQTGGGGGGAGGLRTSYTNSSSLNGHTETALTLTTATNYTVTVAAGGAAVSTDSAGNNGLNSAFGNVSSEITATGGGAGGRGGGGTPYDGADGGSGGGGSQGTSSGGTGGSAVTTPATQGYAGGDGGFDSSNISGAAGGGGASGVGGDGQNGVVGSSGGSGGNGGAGLAVGITGSSETYAGGGGGGAYEYLGSSAGTGGAGGGGAGAIENNTATSGSPNTGGGGGGGGTTSGAGGSGIVILRYPDAYTITETTSGGDVLSFTTDDTTVSGTKITTFTAGDGTIQFST